MHICQLAAYMSPIVLVPTKNKTERETVFIENKASFFQVFLFFFSQMDEDWNEDTDKSTNNVAKKSRFC